GHLGAHLLRAAMARPRQGQVDPLPRPHVQDLAGRVRRVLPDPRLSRRGAGHRVGAVPRALADPRRRRPRNRHRTLPHDRLLPVLPADAVVHGARQDAARAATGDLEMKTLALLLAIVAAVAAPAARAEGPNLMMVPALGHRLDDESLQRGARDFVNYCQGCHSAKYMRYNRHADLGLSEQDIRDNLIFGDAKIGDTMNVAMRPADAKAWFGNPPPDLSVEARVRGTTWLFNYLIGFYRDPKSATGWNNLVFPNVGMPHVLAELQGPRKLVETEYEDHEKALGAAIAAKTLVGIEP